MRKIAYRRRVVLGGFLATIASIVMLVVLVTYPVGASVAAHGQPRAFLSSGPAGRRGHPHWSVWSRSPLGSLFGPTFVWDGHEALEIGGVRAGAQQEASHAVAGFDPVRRSWRRLASMPADVATFDSAAVWAGDQLFVFSGRPQSAGRRACCTAGLLDPARNRWSSVRVAVDPLQQPAAVWTGRQVMVAGVTQDTHPRLEAAVFDPATRRSTRLDPPLPLRHPPADVAIVATRSSVILWSLWSQTTPTGPHSNEIYSGIDVLRLRNGNWRNVTGRWPQHETVSSPSFTGSRILLPPSQIWCGPCSHPAPFHEHGYLVNPSTLSLTSIAHGPLDDIGPAVIWTGAQEIALNEGGEISGLHQHVRLGDTAIWNPNTHRWTREPTAPELPDTLPIWDGHHLLTLATSGRVLAFGR